MRYTCPMQHPRNFMPISKLPRLAAIGKGNAIKGVLPIYTRNVTFRHKGFMVADNNSLKETVSIEKVLRIYYPSVNNSIKAMAYYSRLKRYNYHPHKWPLLYVSNCW